ncbi:MAG: 50S ribosome-binding GTPase, partial [Planctomycetes bacterium]|nr:50S ribosome-binding GTPase [Planctomycetota bacterium]
MWRLYLISTLIIVPLMALVVAGGVALWRTGQYVWLWWLIPACWLPAWLLARRWRRQLVAPVVANGQPADYWTARDRAAWQIVQHTQQQASDASSSQLIDPHFYLQSAMDLGLCLARHYNPKAKDPVGSRSVLEILTVAQLALEDSYRWISVYVPGSHLVTIDQWRMLAKTPRWLNLAGNVGWIASIAINPLNITRFAASKLTVDSAAKQFQDNALAWGYAMFLGRVGFYLIEMNSGRLRIGAARYRELMASATGQRRAESAQVRGETTGRRTTSPSGCEVVVAVVGQVKAGKSSLINALIGERAAEVDVLPATREVRRYRMQYLDDAADGLVLLDTPGYGDDGATDQQRRAIGAALAEADLVLLVMKVSSPAR